MESQSFTKFNAIETSLKSTHFSPVPIQWLYPRPPSSCSCNTSSSLPTDPSCLIKSTAHKGSWCDLLNIQSFILSLLYSSSLVAPHDYAGPCLYLQPRFTPSPLPDPIPSSYSHTGLLLVPPSAPTVLPSASLLYLPPITSTHPSEPHLKNFPNKVQTTAGLPIIYSHSICSFPP